MENIIVDGELTNMLRGHLRGLPGLKYDITFCPSMNLPDKITICNYSPYMKETLTVEYIIEKRMPAKLPNKADGNLFICSGKEGDRRIYVANDKTNVYIL